MKILALETATEACSAALLWNDTLITRYQLAPREHTKLILPMMDEVLDEASITLKQLDAIAFSRGPGAFTGLRIAAGVAQGVALSVDKPVIPVSTLAAIALQAHYIDQSANRIIATLDARMGEIYWATFNVKDGKLKLLDEEKVTKPETLFESILSWQEKPIIVTGTGWDAYGESLLQIDSSTNLIEIKQQYPQAEYIARLAKTLFEEGKTVSCEDAQPVYIRNKVAEKSVVKSV